MGYDMTQEMLTLNVFMKWSLSSTDVSSVRPAELVSVTSPPEAASGGMIGVVKDGDIISINIPENTIELKVDADILAERMKNFIPKKKDEWMAKVNALRKEE